MYEIKRKIFQINYIYFYLGSLKFERKLKIILVIFGLKL